SCAATGGTAPPENDNARHVRRMATICGARGRPMNIVDLPIFFLRVGYGAAVAPEEIFRRRSFPRLVRLEMNPARRRGSRIIVAGRLARGTTPAPPHGTSAPRPPCADPIQPSPACRAKIRTAGPMPCALPHRATGTRPGDDAAQAHGQSLA